MKAKVIGVVVASIVLYIWGFLYWGFGPYGTMIWKQAKDDSAAGRALLEHFPDNGTYYIPGMNHEQETLEGLFESGPVAFVHMISAGGRSMFDPSIMIQGFILNVVVIVLIAVLLQQVSSALPRYWDRVRFTVLAGFTAALLIDIGDVVWWQIDWSWKLYNAFYDVSAWVLTGLILAKFIQADKIHDLQH